MQDPRYRTLEQYMDGDVVTGLDAVTVEREAVRNQVAVIESGHRPRLGKLIAEMAAGLMAAALPTQPLIIISRRAAADDALDGVVYNREDGPLELVPAPEIGIGVHRVRGSDALVVDDPWQTAMLQHEGPRAKNFLDRMIDALALEAVTGTGPRGPMLGWGGLPLPCGAKRRPGSRAWGATLAQRARLADGACTYRPTGSKRTRRRAAGRAFGRFWLGMEQAISAGLDPELVYENRRLVPVETARAWGLGNG